MTSTGRPAPTRKQLDAARGWVSDCVWKEEPEEIDAMTDEEIVAGVDRHYDGGWAALVADADLADDEWEAEQ